MIFIKLITIFIITMTSPRVFKRIPCLGDNWTGFGQTNFKSEWYLSSPQKKGFRAKAIVPGNVRQTLMKE